jgi:hypothetical protein
MDIFHSILDPGQVPEIKGVTRFVLKACHLTYASDIVSHRCRFPAQERVGGDSKIPTIIYYDQGGKVRAVGAEAASEAIEETAEDEGWTKAEWLVVFSSLVINYNRNPIHHLQVQAAHASQINEL